MRIGIVCPYSLDVPGGVQSHVLDLARALIALGHSVSVLAPADDERPAASRRCPRSSHPPGGAVSVPYNGSVARITFGPVSYARVRRWLAEHTFDVLHLHEPGTFSLSSLALFEADGPIVATFHTSTERSRATLVFARPINALMEKVTARIAVSPMARRVQVEHLGGDAVEIPNGVDVALFADGPLLPGYPRDGHTVGFLGRFDEPRKGMAVLLDALRLLAPPRPDLRLLVVGRGDPDALRRDAGPVLADRLDILGGVDDATKAAALRSMDVYCAPNTGGESFGMVLTEAMAAGAAVLASDLGRVPGRAAARRGFRRRPSGYGGWRAVPDRRRPRARLRARRAARRPAAAGRARGRGSRPRRRVRLAGRRGGRAARLPRRHRGRSPPRARPDRREQPVTAPNLGVLVPELTPTAWAVVVVALLLLAVVTWICVVRARRLDRLHRRTDAARAGPRGRAGPPWRRPRCGWPTRSPLRGPEARSHRGRGGTGRRRGPPCPPSLRRHWPAQPATPSTRAGRPCGWREPVSTAARWRRTRSPAGSPASTATRCPRGSPPSSRTSSSPS